MGTMKDILDTIAHLESQNAKYLTFTQKKKTFAEEYDDDNIMNFLRPYLEPYLETDQ